MGTIKKGILGGFSGKVGNVVGASWKGISYIRSLPANMQNPRTEKQVTQRNKFSLMGRLLKTLTPIIRVGFKNSAGAGNSAFSVAMSYNINNAVKGAYPDFEIDFPKVLVASGGLYAANNVTAACAAGILNFGWDTGVLNNAAATDRVMVLAYDVVRGDAVYDMNAATRDAGSGSLALPPAWDGDAVETFVVFTSDDGALVSDSVYTGRLEVVLAGG